MGKSYEQVKRMRAAAIGTIQPWVGDATDLPDGWIECKGQTLDATEFPVLASILGETYGPSGGLNSRTYPNYILGDLFRVPNISGRLLADYEPEYLNVTELQAGQNYPSGSVGGVTIRTGEIDTTRAAETLDFTSKAADSPGTGTGLTFSLVTDSGGKTSVVRIGDVAGSFASLGANFQVGETITISNTEFTTKGGSTGTVEDFVLEIAWIYSPPGDVINPTNGTQLMTGDGSTITPPTSANATADINFVVADSANLTGTMRQFTVNPPTYFRSIYSVPRKLSKDHMAPHRHADPIAADAQYTAAVADGGFVAGFECPNVITQQEGNDKEKRLDFSSGGDTHAPGVYFVTRFAEGVTLRDGAGPQASSVDSIGGAFGNANIGSHNATMPVWSGPIPRPLGGNWNASASGVANNNSTANLRESSNGNLANYKNWYGNLSADQVANAAHWSAPSTSLTYATALNHRRESHTQMQSHNHYSFEVSMNAGFLRAPAIVPVDNIKISHTNSTTQTTNTITAQNIPSALNINMDLKTPALSMMYIIRAY